MLLAPVVLSGSFLAVRFWVVPLAARSTEPAISQFEANAQRCDNPDRCRELARQVRSLIAERGVIVRALSVIAYWWNAASHDGVISEAELSATRRMLEGIVALRGEPPPTESWLDPAAISGR